MKRSAVVPPHSVRAFSLEIPTDLSPGDLVLVSRTSLLNRAISFAERLRRPRKTNRAEWRACCEYSHACIVVKGGDRPVVSQEDGSGNVLSPLVPSPGTSFAAVHVQCSEEQRGAGVEFAEWAVGCDYAYIQIVADLFNAVTGLELSLGWGNAMVCSTQATRTLERMGLIPDRQPAAVTPAHLAAYFEVVSAAIAQLPEAV